MIPIGAAPVLRLADTLAEWRDVGVPVLARLYQCPRCKAPVGDPCVSPSGEPHLSKEQRRAIRAHGSVEHLPEYVRRPRHHAPRTDRGIRAANRACPRAWRADLLRYGARPSVVMREIQRSELYRRLEALRLLDMDPVAFLRHGHTAPRAPRHSAARKDNDR